ncbi:MAG: acyl-CoA dehydrogenase, partial [Pseudomonadota bacterium]
ELAVAAANAATAAGIQIHGAIGVSWEHDLHLYLKRSHALQAPWRSHSSRSELMERLLAMG